MGRVRSEAARVFGQRIRNERQRLAISQGDLAELSDIDLSSVGRIERGHTNPALDTILRLATALNLNPADLVDGLSASMLPGPFHNVTALDLIRARGGTARR